MLRSALNLLFILGIVIALFGFGVDYFLPSTSPGLNLPQLLVISAGLVLSMISVQLRRDELRHRLAKAAGKTFVTALIITLVTLIVLEVVLTVAGMSTDSPVVKAGVEVRPAGWWICDDRGCLNDYNAIVSQCQSGEQTGRICIVNRQGFADTEDFDVNDDFGNQGRILLLGDSFTVGYSAEIGKSFVETIESANPEMIVWNGGTSGSGTDEALATFEVLAPKLKPQLTILGFYMNDFQDNVRGFSVSARFTETETGRVHIVQTQRDRWGNLVELDDKIALLYISQGLSPPVNDLERVMSHTRLGSLGLRLLDRIASTIMGDTEAREIELTRQFLADLRSAAIAQNTTLLTMIIPQRIDIDVRSARYLDSIQLMEELGIPYLEVFDRLSASLDYATPPDNHWSTAGHQKVGALLSECVMAFYASGDLSDCEHVTIP